MHCDINKDTIWKAHAYKTPLYIQLNIKRGKWREYMYIQEPHNMVHLSIESFGTKENRWGWFRNYVHNGGGDFHSPWESSL